MVVERSPSSAAAERTVRRLGGSVGRPLPLAGAFAARVPSTAVPALRRAAGEPARVAVRINPDIDAKSHPHISTGLKINKFGVPVDLARDLLASVAGRPFLKLVAIHVHIGSQITSPAPIRSAARFIVGVATELARAGVTLNVFMLEDSSGLIGFMEQLAELTAGRIFLMDDRDLGTFVLRDFVRRRAS